MSHYYGLNINIKIHKLITKKATRKKFEYQQVTSREAIQCALDRRGMASKITSLLRLTSVAKVRKGTPPVEMVAKCKHEIKTF